MEFNRAQIGEEVEFFADRQQPPLRAIRRIRVVPLGAADGTKQNRISRLTGNDRLIGCDYTEPEFVPDLDLGNAFCVLEGVTTFNYGVDLVCPGEPVEEVIIVETEEPSEPEPDPTRDINLCAVGNAWGDGRCKTDYDWQAGYYYGLLEEGEIVIDDIPGPYYATATPQPTATPKPKKEKKEEAPEFCSDFDGEGWPVYKISTEEFIEYAEDDPGFPSCDFEETPL